MESSAGAFVGVVVELTIVGAGAIGGITGAHLARAGHRVLLVDRDREHVEAIRRDGLEVGGRADFRLRIAACPPEAVPGPIDVLVLAVKTLHTVEALAPLVPKLAAGGYVLSMQNGLEEAKIAALVGAERTVGAFLTFGGHYERPGRVVYSGPGTLRVGELDGRLTDRVRTLARTLSDFHPAEPTDNIHGYLWGKLILGVIYFATATVDADVVDIFADPAARGVLSGLAAEAGAVADAHGIRVEVFDGFDARAAGRHREDPAAADRAWEGQLAYWRGSLAGRTGVWRDLAQRRRKTEAAPILGALIEAADRAGLPVPRVRALLRMIEELERGERAMSRSLTLAP
jgi:2-dehydropantoate 2-reductase